MSRREDENKEQADKAIGLFISWIFKKIKSKFKKKDKDENMYRSRTWWW